jgi:hypothetical protein
MSTASSLNEPPEGRSHVQRDLVESRSRLVGHVAVAVAVKGHVAVNDNDKVNDHVNEKAGRVSP